MRTLLRIAMILGLSACAAAPPASPTAPREASSAFGGSAAAPSASAGAGGAPPTPAASAPDDAPIAKAVDAYLELLVDIHPERATALGLHSRDSELDDRSIAGFDKATDREAEMLASLEKTFASPRASAAAANDLALLLGGLRVDVRTRRVMRPLQRQPDAYVEPLDAIFQLVARDFAPAAQRAKSVLERLEKLPKVVELAKENLLNPPKVWTEIAIEKAAGAKPFLTAQRAFLLASLPAETARVEKALKDATLAYEDYVGYLRRDVMKRSNGRFAAGRELFDYLLANEHFLEEDADRLLAVGKRVFARTSEEMTAVAKRIDPGAKDWTVVTKRLKGKHPPAAELLASYRKEVVRAREFLVQKDVVSFPPGERLDVIDTPTFMRATTSAAYDAPPAFEEHGAKGLFFVTPVDASLPPARQEEMLRENDFADIVDTSVHEAYPGHHLQLSFARTSPSKARRVFGHSIFEEGWGLYSEELMAELGYYDDEQRLIQLEWTLVRAARIIIDVGLHTRDMTYEQAIKMLVDEVHLERPLAVSEARRYTEEPTQPSAYVIGREKILELRERAKARAGAKFSLKAFHTDLLSRGGLPLRLAEAEMFSPSPSM